MVESHWVKPAPIPLINRSVDGSLPSYPRPFKYRFVFKGLLQKRNPVGEHLIDISSLGMYYHSYILVNSQLFRDGWLYLKLLALLLIIFLPFPPFGLPVSLPFSISTEMM